MILKLYMTEDLKPKELFKTGLNIIVLILVYRAEYLLLNILILMFGF